MKKHDYLIKAKKTLINQGFNVDFVEGNILQITDGPVGLPYVFLVVEDHYDGIIISPSIVYPTPSHIIDIIISLFYIAPVSRGDAFYSTNSGKIVWGENADRYLTLEMDSNLLRELNPASPEIH